MKESVTKFDLEAAFKALDELDVPVAKKGIAANRVNLKETFNRKLKTEALIEDYYDVNNSEDLNQAAEDRQAEVAQAKLARIEKIVDLDAETEEDILPSYEGKIIVQCPQCMTLFYKNPEDVEASEDDDTIVNVGEVCQHCGNESGYTVIGKVAAVEPEAEESIEGEEDLNLDFEEPVDEDEEKISVEEPSEEATEETVEEPTEDEAELELEPIEDEPEEEKKEEALDSAAKTVLTEAAEDVEEEKVEDEEEVVEEDPVIEENPEEVDADNISEEPVEEVVEDPTEGEDALEVLKDKIDVHGEGETVIIAEKGQLDNEEAPKVEVEVSEEEFDTLEKEFHEEETEEAKEEEPAEEIEAEVKVEDEIATPEEVEAEIEAEAVEEIPADAEEEKVEEAVEAKEEMPIKEALSDGMDRFEMQEFLEDHIGKDETLEALVRAMSEDQMKDLFDYIVRMYDLENENLDEAITIDNAKKKDDFIFQKDGNSAHETDFMHLAKRYIDYRLNKENADEMSQPKVLAEKIKNNYKLVRYYFISILFKWTELRQALSNKLAYFKYNDDQIKKIWEFILSKKAEWSTDYNDAVVYIKKALNDAKTNKTAQAKIEKETSEDTNIEEALAIKEDVSDSDFEELISSDEYKEPISVEEVKAYWSESLHNSLTESLAAIENISEESLNKVIKESLQQVYENVKDFETKDCSLNNNQFKVEGLITFVSGNTRPTTYVFTEATVNNKNKEKIILEGYNDTLDPNGKFYLECCLVNKKSNLITEKLTYSYHINGVLVEKLN